ncbi:MAG: hypothetical protein D3923_06030, partial [Candidatus Electrothrix sp. AR3]|nr:hypothetical protein [Candidatus Electrothrix sp. AR3]
CATTWTSLCLNAHPDIYMAQGDGKTYFFNRYYEQGLQGYARFFAQAPAGLSKGEQTETYLFDDQVPQRIAQELPDVKIFAIFRNPVERAFSTYLHLVRDGILKPGTFAEEIRLKDKIFIRDSLYAERFKSYYDLFPAENIHVQLYEDIKNDPKKFLQELYGFIGVDNDFLPPLFDQQVNATVAPRFPWLNKLMTLSGWLMRDLGMVKFRYAIRNSALMGALRFKQTEQPKLAMPSAIETMLYEIFQKPNEEFARLIQRDLSEWQHRSQPLE